MSGAGRLGLFLTLVPGVALQSGVPGRLRLQVRSRVPLYSVRRVVEGDEGLAGVGSEEVPGTTTTFTLFAFSKAGKTYCVYAFSMVPPFMPM